MAEPQQQQILFRKYRLTLAIQAYQQGHIPSLNAATNLYDAPRGTAQQRIKGIQPKRGSVASNRRLTPVEEESLKQWIL